MIKIPLGRDNMYAMLSDKDKDLASLSWYAHRSGDGFYAAHREGTGERRRVWMHREVMERMIGRSLLPGELVDHIDQNKLNNVRGNLRVVTKSLNEANKTIWNRGSSRYRGVSWSAEKRRWKATIQVNNKQIHLGYFGTENEAAMVWNDAALDYFGEHATINPIVHEEKYDERGHRK